MYVDAELFSALQHRWGTKGRSFKVDTAQTLSFSCLMFIYCINPLVNRRSGRRDINKSRRERAAREGVNYICMSSLFSSCFSFFSRCYVVYSERS